MSDINWIKLRIDMFDDEKIKIIQSMPEGDAILVIWIRLIAIAGKCNANGFVLVEDEFPYSDEMLSVIFNKPLATIRLALTTFEKFRMIERTQKGIYITNFEKHQNIEGMDKIREQNRIRKQRERERKRALLEEENKNIPALPEPEEAKQDNDSVMCHVTVTSESREVTQQRENKNKNIDIYNISPNGDIVEQSEKNASDISEQETERQRISYDAIKIDYNRTCVSLPPIRAMSEARKRQIRNLLSELEKLKIGPEMTPYDRLHTIFAEAENSDFLSGRTGKWNGCSFDWLINKTNALKVLEGNYKNKGGAGGGRNYPADNKQNVSRPDGATNEALERFRRNRHESDDTDV